MLESFSNLPEGTKVIGVEIETATPIEKIKENIAANLQRFLPSVDKISEWREQVPVAIVGGGPSLKGCLNELRGFKYILAAGSVHDYLMENDIIPTWCAICDPDPVMNKYLNKLNPLTTYFVASQCDSSTFELFQTYHYYEEPPKLVIWHLHCDDGSIHNNDIYGENAVTVRGGCTIGTRSMVLAINMGFYHLHLFGMDTCMGKGDEYHAYGFQDEEYEKSFVSDIRDVSFEPNGPVFRVAGYQLAQLFDIRVLSRQFAKRMHVTVHGDSLLSYYYELAKKKFEKLQLEKTNGNGTRPNGIGGESISSSPSS